MRTYAPTKSKATQQTKTGGHRPVRHSILQLQCTIGNQALERTLRANTKHFEPHEATIASTSFTHGLAPLPLHTGVHGGKIGIPGDKHEKKADRVAEQVTRLPEHGVSGSTMGSQYQHSNQALSSQERAFFEPRFGHDLSHVRIHADNRSAEIANIINAHAFTVGRDIYFGTGMRQAHTRKARPILAHELAHVLQQERGALALQPKLKLDGSLQNCERVVEVLNDSLLGYHVSIDEAGNLTLSEGSERAGPPTDQQIALLNRLRTIINDPNNVVILVASRTQELTAGFNFQTIDIYDIEHQGVHVLIHEIEEQFQKQVQGLEYGAAHAEGIRAELEDLGAQVKEETIMPGATKDEVRKTIVRGTIETTYQFPGNVVRVMVVQVVNNNVTEVTWRE